MGAVQGSPVNLRPQEVLVVMVLSWTCKKTVLSRLVAEALLHEAIPHPVYREQVARARRVGLQASAQLGDVVSTVRVVG